MVHADTEVGDDGHLTIDGQYSVQLIQRLIRLQRRFAQTFAQAVLHSFITGQVTCVTNRPPGDARSRQAQVLTQARQAFQACIGGYIVRLSGVTNRSRHRGIQHEVRQLQILGSQVQIPCTHQLGLQHLVQTVLIHIGDQAIIKYSGSISIVAGNICVVRIEIIIACRPTKRNRLKA